MNRVTTQGLLRKSILELRQIYSDLNDEQFIKWYSRHYRVTANMVRQVLEEGCSAVKTRSGVRK